MKIVPDLPMRGRSKLPIISPVMNHHLQIALRAGCPATAVAAKRPGPGPGGEPGADVGDAWLRESENSRSAAASVGYGKPSWAAVPPYAWRRRLARRLSVRSG